MDSQVRHGARLFRKARVALASGLGALGLCAGMSAQMSLQAEVAGQTASPSPALSASVDVDVDYGTWTSLEGGLSGSAGVPVLSGTGTLLPSDSTGLLLVSARPLAHAYLVIGLEHIGRPFRGGVLVPSPDMILGLQVGGDGAIPVPFVWPPDMASGSSLYFQFWIRDAGSRSGFAASNGLQATAP